MMTHDYNRAVKYYETRLAEDPKLIDLRTDLAELYLKLKVFDQSKRVLIDALKNVKFLVLMAKVCLDEDMQYPGWKLKENQDAKQAIIEALTLQSDVIEICRSTSADRVDEEREFSAEISFRLGCYMEERAGNSEDALLAYNDCLARNTNHIDA